MKSLWDGGAIRGTVVVCTGSSAIDLQHGAAERLPGRREAGVDHLVLPQCFAAFARAAERRIPASPRLTVAELCCRRGEALLLTCRYTAGAAGALERYLRFGGLPAAVAEAASGAHEPSREVKRVLYDSLVRELQRRGASVPAGHALLERVMRSLGAEGQLERDGARDGCPAGARHGAPQPSDAARLHRAAGRRLLPVRRLLLEGRARTPTRYRGTRRCSSPTRCCTRSRSKARPGSRSTRPRSSRTRSEWRCSRRYEPADRLLETFVLPERLHIWQTARGGEIDFVCGPRRELDAVEVKYREHPTLSAAAAAARAHPGRPVVMVTKNALQIAERYTLIPAHMLLWALG